MCMFWCDANLLKHTKNSVANQRYCAVTVHDTAKSESERKAHRAERALLRVEVLPRGRVDQSRGVDEDHVGAEAVLHPNVNLAGVERTHRVLLQPPILRFDVRLVFVFCRTRSKCLHACQVPRDDDVGAPKHAITDQYSVVVAGDGDAITFSSFLRLFAHVVFCRKTRPEK